MAMEVTTLNEPVISSVGMCYVAALELSLGIYFTLRAIDATLQKWDSELATPVFMARFKGFKAVLSALMPWMMLLIFKNHLPPALGAFLASMFLWMSTVDDASTTPIVSCIHHFVFLGVKLLIDNRFVVIAEVHPVLYVCTGITLIVSTLPYGLHNIYGENRNWPTGVKVSIFLIRPSVTIVAALFLYWHHRFDCPGCVALITIYASETLFLSAYFMGFILHPAVCLTLQLPAVPAGIPSP